jgi:hypothetical protein
VRVEWVALLLGVALLPPLQWGFDAYPGERATTLTTLPPRQLLPVLACGQGGTAADLLEIKATNYLLSTLRPGERMNPDVLQRFFTAITTLDPYDPDAVVRAAVFLSTMADHAEDAVVMLEAAVDRIPHEHPRRWVLHWELVAIHITTLAYQNRERRDQHVRRAGELLLEISSLPGVQNPDAFFTLGEKLSTRGLDEREALESELGFWEERTLSGEPAVRERAQQRLDEVRCGLRREHLQRALDAFRSQVGRFPQHLSELRLDMDDPLGVGFFRLGTRVVSPAYEARRLERALLTRHERWVQANAGEPTADDLGLSDLAPFLRMELSRDAVRVQPAVNVPPGGTLAD